MRTHLLAFIAGVLVAAAILYVTGFWDDAAQFIEESESPCQYADASRCF